MHDDEPLSFPTVAIVRPPELSVIFGEPPRTQADINFRIANIPIRIHPFFWVIAVLLGIQGSEVDPAEMLLWVAAVLVSITIHELGHAFAIRHFGGRPHVLLHAFGGLAFGTPDNISPRNHILILLAGPGAGFLLAGLITAVIAATGHLIGFEFSLMPVIFEPYQDLAELFAAGQMRFGRLDFLIMQLLYINIAWGLINLLPVFPLDGGQIARTVMIERDPYRGAVQSLWVSIFTGGALAVFAITRREFYVAALFGYLAFMSYQMLQAHTGRGGRGW